MLLQSKRHEQSSVNLLAMAKICSLYRSNVESAEMGCPAFHEISAEGAKEKMEGVKGPNECLVDVVHV